MMRADASAMRGLPRWSLVPGEAPLLRSRNLENMLQALDLGGEDALTEVGEPVVAPPLIVEFRIGAFIPLDDQSLCKHLFDRTVECPRPETDFPLGVAVHFLHDAVAMMVTTDERQQDMEHRRRQRQEAFRVRLTNLCHALP